MLTQMNRRIATLESFDMKKPDYVEALTSLIQIEDPTLEGGLGDYIKWIKKYARSRDFLNNLYQLVERDSYDYSDSWMKYVDSLSSKNPDDRLEKELKKLGVEYIKNIYEIKHSQYFIQPNLIVDAKNRLTTIARLFLFLRGEKVNVEPYAVNGYPVFPKSLIVSLNGFLDLRSLVSLRDFLILEQDANERVIIEDVDTISVEELERKHNDYDDFRNDLGLEDTFDVNRPIPISRSSVFGSRYCKLFEEILSMYIEKCSSFSNFWYEEKRSPAYRFDVINQRMQPFTSKDFFDYIESEQYYQNYFNWEGIYKLHKTLRDALLKSHLTTCEYCGKPFITLRSDKKTCSDSCRTRLYLLKKKQNSGQQSVTD